MDGHNNYIDFQFEAFVCKIIAIDQFAVVFFNNKRP